MGAGASAGLAACVQTASSEELRIAVGGLHELQRVRRVLNELHPRLQTFLFIFSKMPGDINPSFPVARNLVGRGHSVYYLCPDFQAAIEDTGAKFLDASRYYDLYKEGRTPETFGAANQLKKELGLPESDGEYMVRIKIRNVEMEKKLGGVLAAIKETKATVIVYDPVLNHEAAVAAKIAKVPAAALLAFNGLGAWAELVQSKMKNDLPDVTSEEERIKIFEGASLNALNVAATERLNQKYVSEGMPPLDGKFTGGRIDGPAPDIWVITTTEEMKASETPDLALGAEVVYVGTLLDEPGALRAGGPPTKDLWKQVDAAMDEKSNTGKTIFVSLGTVTTADGPLGWQGSPDSCLTGEKLCQAVWGAAFDALGGEKGSGNVILLTTGKDSKGDPRPFADGEKVPGNALCGKSMPQVDILSKGIDLFVTHAGQNSFVEAITMQTPMLCVPTVGDQIGNAEQAVQMGVGLTVSRPPPGDQDIDSVAAKYRSEVKGKMLELLANPSPFKDAVVRASSKYRASGVNKTIEILEAL